MSEQPKVMGYRKIPGPFKRDPESHEINRKLWSDDALGYLADLEWVWTEKIDGTNIRIIWDGYRIEWRGRTDRAQIPGPLNLYLKERFGTSEAEELFEQNFGDQPAIMFGEGYGPGIQKGGWYRDDVSFIAFDVFQGYYFEQKQVNGLAIALGAERTAPSYGYSTLNAMIRRVRGREIQSIESAGHEPEGVIGTPAVPLRGRRGNQIVVKLKANNV